VRADPSRVEAGASSDAASSPDRRLEAAAAAPQASVNSTLARSVVRDAAKMAAAIEIVSPDAKVRWRISGTNVEHSDDGGMTWQTQPTGVTAVLTSGAAPSPSVCWIVGASGTVVRSVDGRSWQRIAFHDAIDLRAVRASDATHAVVTAVDGRAFATGDGGRTWQANGR
jgi:photosystem II stability/assembly factor-like uncharacterized protein